MSAAMMLASCGGTKDAGQNGTLIERSDIKIEGKRMTPEALWAMGIIIFYFKQGYGLGFITASWFMDRDDRFRQ